MKCLKKSTSWNRYDINKNVKLYKGYNRFVLKKEIEGENNGIRK